MAKEAAKVAAPSIEEKVREDGRLDSCKLFNELAHEADEIQGEG